MFENEISKLVFYFANKVVLFFADISGFLDNDAFFDYFNSKLREESYW